MTAIIQAKYGGLRQGRRGGGDEKGWILDILLYFDFSFKPLMYIQKIPEGYNEHLLFPHPPSAAVSTPPLPLSLSLLLPLFAEALESKLHTS